MMPEVYYQHTTELCQRALKRCEMLERHYTKPGFLLNCHMETIWGALFRKRPNLPLQRYFLETPDGGILTLDVLKTDQSLPPGAPVLLLMAGLAGGSSCTYVQYAMQSAYEAGIHAIAFNCRGTAGSPVKTAQFYSASFTEDLRLVGIHLKTEYPDSPLCVMGWSLGANILVNYLAEEGPDSPFLAAASLCNPFDLEICDQNLKQGAVHQAYDQHLASNMQKCFAPHMKLFKDYDVNAAMTAKTIRDIDAVLTSVTFGWNDVDHYYRNSGCAQRISKVAIPLLCIQAEDDPIAVDRAIPKDAIHSNEHCTLVLTPHGGHLGWVTREDGIFVYCK
eukprot:g7332.t1